MYIQRYTFGGPPRGASQNSDVPLTPTIPVGQPSTATGTLVYLFFMLCLVYGSRSSLIIFLSVRVRG